MKISDFELELQRIHPDLTVISNPKIEALAGVYFQGSFLFGIPNHNIYDEANSAYSIELPTGMMMRHRTRPEALAMAKEQIRQLKFSPDEADAILGRGKYSAAALKADDSEILTPSSNPEAFRLR